MKLLKGFTPYKKEDVEKYNRLRWWAGLTFGDVLDKAADIYPDREALVNDRSRPTYSQVREMANRLAIGTRIMDYPFTPDKVLKALGKIR